MSDSNTQETAETEGLAPAVSSAEDIDTYQTEDYHRHLAECAKHCYCDHEICDSVLAGAPCEGRIRDLLDDDE